MELAMLEKEVVPFSYPRHLRAVTELVVTDFADAPGSWRDGPVRELIGLPRLAPMAAGLVRRALRNRPTIGFVWIKDGKVIGNITLHPVGTDRKRWEIEDVGVVRSYRKRGMGRALMLMGLREIARRGGGCVVLKVFDDNEPARRLYESLGFAVTGPVDQPPRHLKIGMSRPVTLADLRLLLAPSGRA